MKLLFTLPFLSFFFILNSCGQDSSSGVEKVVREYLIESGTIKDNVNSKVLNVQFSKTITAKDSANYLLASNLRKIQEEYDHRFKNIKASKNYIEKDKRKLSESENLQESRKQYLQNEIDKRQAAVDDNTLWINNLYRAINGDYQGSDFDDLFKKIEKYKALGDLELGKIYEVEYQALGSSGGSRSIQKNNVIFLLSPDDKRVISQCHESEMHFFDDSVDLSFVQLIK